MPSLLRLISGSALDRRLLLILAGLFVVTTSLGADWPEVTEEEKALKASTIDPDATAEYLNVEETVNDTDPSWGRKSYYCRVKVYDARAIESFMPIDIPYQTHERVRSIQARIIRPDGTEVTLNKKDIYDRETLRKGSERVRTKSFALPGVEPGCIIDYRVEIRTVNIFNAAMLFTPTQDYPIRRYSLKHVPFPALNVNYRWYQIPGKPKITRSYFLLEMKDLKAKSPDLYQPPPMVLYPWVSAAYTTKKHWEKDGPDEYWSDVGGWVNDLEKDYIDGGQKAVKEKARTLTEGAANDAEKLARLYDFCTRGIPDPSDPHAGYTLDEMADLEDNDSPAETLKHNYAFPVDRVFLFASLARAAGFKARLTWATNLENAVFDERVEFGIAVEDMLVAVDMGQENWVYYDLIRKNLPPAHLSWQNNGVTAFMIWDKWWRWSKTQSTPAHMNRSERKADLALDEAGRLTGRVEIRFFGDPCTEMKNSLHYLTEKERADFFRNELKQRMPQAEIAGFSLENIATNLEPLIVAYEVDVPDYATFANNRLLINPSFFECGETPIFTRKERDTDIRFPYQWKIQDNVNITLPDTSWKWDGNTRPQGVLDTPRIAHVLGVNQKGRLLSYQRKEVQNLGVFPRAKYGDLKQVLEEINAQDQSPVGFIKKVETEEAPQVAAEAEAAPASEPAAVPAGQ